MASALPTQSALGDHRVVTSENLLDFIEASNKAKKFVSNHK